MEIVKFSIGTHFELLGAWLKDRGQSVPTIDEIPAIGVVAVNGSEPIAMGFLRRVEGGFGQLDGLVTNPNAEGFLRHAAIGMVVGEIVRLAQELKIKGLMAWTVDKSIICRAPRHGFVQLPGHVVLAHTLVHKGTIE